jgi:FAD:protein FMN transferase
MNKNKKQKLALLLSTCFFIVLLTGCSLKVPGNTKQEDSKEKNDYITKSEFKLNTYVTITLYDSKDESILDGALDVCDKYEQIYSRTLETSELYKLNNRQLQVDESSMNTYVVSEELSDILDKGLYYSKLSGGAFDITVAPITSLWDFTSGEKIVPDAQKIAEAVKYIGFNNVEVEGNKVTLKEDTTMIDLGAIAKGYIADRIKDYLVGQGIKSAMINLGGNVLCVGNKPGNIPFKVGIQKPFADRNETTAVMEISDLSVVSSGVYERYFIKDDKLYHHILNPSTGYPYDNNIISTTIISKYSTDGDGLSTTTFALGLDKALELINSLEDTYAVFITEDYKLHYSEGFFDHIKVTEVE